MKTRPFEVSSPAEHGGTCALEGTTESEDCNTDVCPSDCEGAFSDWSACTVECGGGNQTRAFNVTAPAVGTGGCPHEGAEEEQACNLHDCPIDCVGGWSAFTECSHTCGIYGTQSRTYVVTTPCLLYTSDAADE